MIFKKGNTALSGGVGNPVLIWGGIFLVLTMLAGGAFWKSAQYQQAGRYYSEVAGDLRLLSQQMTTQALSATQGVEQSFLLLARYKTLFEKALQKLRDGDPETNMPALSAEMQPELEQIDKQWLTYARDIDKILASREVISRAKGIVDTVGRKLPGLQADAESVAEIMRDANIRGRQLYFASRQLMLAERIRNSLNEMLSGTSSALDAADQLDRDVNQFSAVIDGLLKGNPDLGISAVNIKKAKKILERMVFDFSEIADTSGQLVGIAPDLYEISEAAGAIEGNGRNLFEGTSRFEAAINQANKSNQLWSTLGFVLGFLSLLSFLMLVLGVIRNTQRQLVQTRETNDRNQQAILTLLDEMATLADGDLTVNATVTEDITGAIADSVNYAIEALRNLVTAINQAAAKVARTSTHTKESALQLARSSEEQAEKIESASDAISGLTRSIEKVSENAGLSADVAEQSLTIAQRGVETVRRSIEGMDSIRENIQDTSKRIKRLGESSQEIGDIVGLITDIADQTNILALNAAIQASSAGEGGRGFAVVADEVQRLAERAANASKQIEALIRTIQADTNEAIQSMEKSTSNVVVGAQQSEEAGNALEEIESVSTKLAEHIRNISEESREQSVVSSVVSEAMNSIREIARATLASSKETAIAVGELAEQAEELRHSAEGFKLPESAVDAILEFDSLSETEENPTLSTEFNAKDSLAQV
jgi:twitching motility protein PilJ